MVCPSEEQQVWTSKQSPPPVHYLQQSFSNKVQEPTGYVANTRNTHNSAKPIEDRPNLCPLDWWL